MQKKLYTTITITILLTAIDQLTKQIVKTTLLKTSITSFFSLEYAQNPGIAWSIKIPKTILLPLTIIIFTALIYYLIKNLNLNKKLSILILSLITSGAIGNIIDRILYGFVIDFIKIGSWPTFNIADAYLTTGGFLIIIFYGKIIRKNKKQ